MLAAIAALGVVAGRAAADDAEGIAKRRAFLYSLEPGVTEEAVVAALGKPDDEVPGRLTYRAGPYRP